MYRRIDLAAFSTVVTIGRPEDEARVHSMIQELGMSLAGAESSGKAALELIDSLAVAPHLIVLDAVSAGMDVTDFLLALSQRAWSANVVFHGIECARINDTVQNLAASLALPPCAGLAGPLCADSLKAAIGEIGAANKRSIEAPRLSCAPTPVFDTMAIRSGLLRGEFELYYQPKIRLSDGSLQGAEALLRWNHPQLGLLSPASFLRNAENGGLAELLTMTVLNLALADLQIWAAMGRSFKISLNFSPLALENPHLADQMVETIRRSGIRPSCISFEITEYSEIGDLSAALRNVLKLRLNGHALSLDDFGAGHASVLQLSRIPFSELKADQKLVRGAWSRPHLKPLLRLAVESARELKIASVAEGVETRADLDFVRSLGFDMGQGFYISRPMQAHMLPTWQPLFAQAAA